MFIYRSGVFESLLYSIPIQKYTKRSKKARKWLKITKNYQKFSPKWPPHPHFFLIFSSGKQFHVFESHPYSITIQKYSKQQKNGKKWPKMVENGPKFSPKWSPPYVLTSCLAHENHFRLLNNSKSLSPVQDMTPSRAEPRGGGKCPKIPKNDKECAGTKNRGPSQTYISIKKSFPAKKTAKKKSSSLSYLVI